MPGISSLVFIVLFTYPVLAQESLSTTDLYGKVDYMSIIGSQTDYIRRVYYQNVDMIDELVNGRGYIPYYFRSKEKPLLYFDRRHKSSMTLNGRRYDNLMLEYDTFKDELLYSDSLKLIDNEVFMISMNKDLVDGFCFYFGSDSLYFRYFSSETNMNFNLSEGFYEVGYDGHTKLIVKHKSLLLVKEGNEEYVYKPAYFIMVNDGYTKITSKKVFLSLFGDSAGEIKKFIGTNKVRLRKANKNEIATVLKYYDSLILSDK